MPSNITASSVFTEPVQIPNNGEVASASDLLSTTIQPLTNRTQYLKDRVDNAEATITNQLQPLRLCGSWRIQGTAVSNADPLTLTKVLDPASAFATASNEITIPSTGYYLLSVRALVRNTSDAGPVAAGFTIDGDHITQQFYGFRYSNEPNHVISVSGTLLVSLDAGDKFEVTALATNASLSSNQGTITIVDFDSYLTLNRVR